MDSAYYPDGLSEIVLKATPLPKDIVQLMLLFHGPLEQLRRWVRDTISQYCFAHRYFCDAMNNRRSALQDQRKLDMLFNIFPSKILELTMIYCGKTAPQMTDHYIALRAGKLLPASNTASSFCCELLLVS